MGWTQSVWRQVERPVPSNAFIAKCNDDNAGFSACGRMNKPQIWFLSRREPFSSK